MEIHPKFKLNGESYSVQELKEVAYSLVKEGKPFEVSIGNFLLNWLSTSKTLTVSTSGSTGTAKQIQLQKTQMVNSALATGSLFNLKAGNSALLCLPCNFIAGKMMLVRAMVLGLEMDSVEPSSNPLREVIKTYDFGAMIPLQAQNSLKKLQLIDKLILGGTPLNQKLRNQLSPLNTSIYETYGMTETITHIAVRKLEADKFVTLPDVTVVQDSRECLVINAPKILTEEVITNDVVELISNTEFKWLGRYDTVINSGGIKLIPEQIELKLSKIIDNRFFVAGIPDETLGEKLVLVVESSEISTLAEKLKFVEGLSKFELPKAIYFIPEFKETKNGKLHRSKTMKLIKN
ncbi:AMP-binding protein [Croceitalea marina]|uniref:AMP-binding protein n=1 Tax=Croceitalea marina TaxID=1775166 RepID=A0ABW5MXN8_9FLAO